MLRFRKTSFPARRVAFSLAELVISIGILILMMALAGQVFSITIKSTGQATALTEVTQQLRVLEETLREDLRNVHPGQSFMLLQGNPVNAYWTQLGKEADDNDNPFDGYGHLRDLEREKLKLDGTPDLTADARKIEKMVEPRADILMFFTARKATSSVNPSISSRVQQVVYNHAELGEYDRDPAVATMSPTPFPTLNQAFQTPAQQWHLARRSVLVIPTDLPPGSNALSWDKIKVQDSNGVGLGYKDFLEGQSDVVSSFRYDDLVLKPWDDKNKWNSEPPWFLPSIFGNTLGVQPANWHKPYSRCKLDPTPPMMKASRMGAFFLPNCASFKVEWSLDPRSAFVNGRLDGTSEVFWIDPGHDAGTPDDPADDNPLFSIQKRIEELDKKNDEASDNLKVQLESLLCEPVVHADGDKYSLADRFRGVSCEGYEDAEYPPWPPLAPDGRPNMVAFMASRPGGKCSQTLFRCLVNEDCESGEYCIQDFAPDDVWPGALRITVDLYDRESRLERPIRHVMVIPIGG